MILNFNIDHFTTQEDFDAMIACLTTLRKVAYTDKQMKDSRKRMHK
jgi:hypothetical protein